MFQRKSCKSRSENSKITTAAAAASEKRRNVSRKSRRMYWTELKRTNRKRWRNVKSWPCRKTKEKSVLCKVVLPECGYWKVKMMWRNVLGCNSANEKCCKQRADSSRHFGLPSLPVSHQTSRKICTGGDSRRVGEMSRRVSHQYSSAFLTSPSESSRDPLDQSSIFIISIVPLP